MAALATTMDYTCFKDANATLERPPTYMPGLLIGLLLCLKPIDAVYRLLRARR